MLKKISKSFYDWCIENNQQNILNRWDNELNDCSPKDITYGTKKQYYFKCPKGIHKSELKNINSFTNGSNGTMNCKQCNSFKQWCIENNRQDILNRWDYELNKCKPDEISYAINKKYYFKCPRDIHKSELKKISGFTSGQEGSIECNQCNSFAQWGIDNVGEDFLEKYWDYEKNDKLNINPWKISYGNHKEKIWIKCQEKSYHESYDIRCNDFINGDRCSYCRGFKVHPLDSLGKLLEEKGLLDIWSEKNKKSPYEYMPKSNKKVYWKCPDGKHEDYKRKINDSNTYNFRCSDCTRERDESFLQEKVRLYLESLNNSEYTILHENKCTIVPKNPKRKGTNNALPFDNEIKELKLICEVNGKQHYEITGFHYLSTKYNNTTPEYELHKIQLYDRYKRFIAYKQGYKYIAIPYWTDDKDESWKKIINDKIKEIS